MVSVGAPDLLLRDAERTLRVLLDEVTDDVDRAFIAYVSRDRQSISELEVAADRARGHRGAARSYRDVAVLGFAAELIGAADATLREASVWLAGTTPTITRVPTGIVEDRVALLGAALAAKHAGPDTGLGNWLAALVKPSDRDSGIDIALLRATAGLLGTSVPTGSTTSEVELAFARLGLLPRTDVDAATVVDAILRGDLATDSRGAVLQLAAIAEVRTRLPTIDLARASSADVGRLLRRVPVALQQWTWEQRPMVQGGVARQWHIDHEYQVQNLLWAIFAPVFQDLRREEYTESVGPLQPRVDLGIPSLRLIIEVKFWRDSLSAAKLVEQIASDSSVYFTATERRYDNLAVFVWDNARRTEKYDELLRGLHLLPHVLDAVIVARPGKMVLAS
jgi:REase_DpnII-MboI